MARSLVPICVIANDVCADLGDSVGKHRISITRHLVDCYRDFSTYLAGSFDIKTEVLPVDHEIVMPSDFIYPTKVGVKRGNCIAILQLDKSLPCEKMNDSEVEDYLDGVWNETYFGDGYWFYNAYRNGDYLGELYGIGRTVINAGTYRFDRKNGVIHIGSNIPKDSEIVIEYKSDGLADGLKMVPSEIKKMMEYYAKSEWYADRNVTQSQINRNLYKTAYRKVKRLYNFESALYMADKINRMFSPTNY